MKNKKKLFICLIPVLLVASVICFVLFRHALTEELSISEKNYVHKYVYFGKYPQTQVEDETLINRLNQLPLEWHSYGYYNGDGSLGSAKQSDYMQYADAELDGETYRAVRFFEYRSFCCHLSPDGTSWQPLLFELNTNYWYHYEPIRWIVLGETENLLMSEKVLDSQPINSIIYAKKPELGFDAPEFYKDNECTVYASNYYSSDIRIWLNDTFLETAFSYEEVSSILYTELDNSAWSKRYSKFDSKSTTDQVFLLSYEEVTNPTYGFAKQAEAEDILRIAYATDYAICQGVCIVQDGYHEGATWWWLRTPNKSNIGNLASNFHGSIQFSLTTTYSPDCVDTGIRPALRLDHLLLGDN